MKSQLFFGVIAVVMFACGCDNDRMYEKKYSNGTIKSTVPIDEQNKRNGIEKGYWPNGVIEYEVEWKHDIEDGLRKEYYESGKLKVKTTFKSGINDGEFCEYFENGNLKMKSIKVQGKETGERNSYFSNGALHRHALVRNDTTIFYIKFDSLGIATKSDGVFNVVSLHGISEKASTDKPDTLIINKTKEISVTIVDSVISKYYTEGIIHYYLSIELAEKNEFAYEDKAVFKNGKFIFANLDKVKPNRLYYVSIDISSPKAAADCKAFGWNRKIYIKRYVGNAPPTT